MMNMGGPSTPSETGIFLNRLFNDTDIIDLGGGLVQKTIGTFVAKRRTPAIMEQYALIGGSPIRYWTDFQGKAMCKLLDKTRPESAPHKAYTAFRYATPLTKDALVEMKADGVTHAIAFSQFPQWSCTTSGSSMNELWRQVHAEGLSTTFKWSIIDRWSLHDRFIEAVTDRIETVLTSKLKPDERSTAIIVFSAHSVPMKVVGKGDTYTTEVAATVQAVMQSWRNKVDANKISGILPGQSNHYIMAWQSKVGFLPWMVPSTSTVIKSLGGCHVIIVPIAFTSDHIETLFEINIEYLEEATAAGIKTFNCTEGLNGSAIFSNALAEIVQNHLDRKTNHSPQYKMKCLGCVKLMCRKLINPYHTNTQPKTM